MVHSYSYSEYVTKYHRKKRSIYLVNFARDIFTHLSVTYATDVGGFLKQIFCLIAVVREALATLISRNH